MTTSSDDEQGRSTSPRADLPPRGDDRDIRHHPLYKTPWWRKPLKPYAFWIVIGVMAAVVVAAVIVTLSLGIALF